MAAMGFPGIQQAAQLCYHKAHYLAEKLCALPGFALRDPDAPFFHEFVTKTPVPAETLLSALAQKGGQGYGHGPALHYAARQGHGLDAQIPGRLRGRFFALLRAGTGGGVDRDFGGDPAGVSVSISMPNTAPRWQVTDPNLR